MDINSLRPSFDAAIADPVMVRNLVVTVVLWTVALVARALMASYLRRRGLAPTELRRLMATSRNLILFILAVATITVWFDELRTFAVSLVAVAAAIVIATKELIMGAGGTFLRTSAKLFDIGDRIEVNGMRGDVIDTSLFTTTVLEIGPGRVGHSQTGRAIAFPNAMLLTSPVVNESFSYPFMVHTFEIVVAASDALVAESALLKACDDELGAYLDDARRHFETRQQERGLEMPWLEPRVLFRLDSPATTTLIATMVAPARRKGWIEQAILRRYLALVPPTSTSAASPSAIPVSTGP